MTRCICAVLVLLAATAPAYGAGSTAITPLAPDDVTDVRAQGAWPEPDPLAIFTPLPAMDSAGNAALHYALIEVRDAHEQRALATLGIYHDTLPLFPQELDPLLGTLVTPVTIDAAGDETGVFVYALLPAVLYNQLAQHALAGEIVFRTVTLREIPDPAARDTGDPTRVAYAYLHHHQFQYVVEDESDAEGLDPADSPASAIAAEINAAVESRVDAIPLAIGTSPHLIVNDRVQVAVTVNALNTDPRFVDAAGDPRPLLRGWGAGISAKSRILLPGLPVVGRQGILRNVGVVGDIPLIVNGGPQNVASVSVRKNREVLWCIRHRTAGAVVTGSLLLASWKCFDRDTYSADARHTLRVANDTRMNLLAQAQDGYAFLTQMVKIQPRRAHILIGPIAELIGAINGGAAFAACGAYNSTVMKHILTPLLFGLGLPSGIGLALDRVDIVYPSTSPRRSRGIMSHEYGHFALCTLMQAASPLGFEHAWADVFTDVIQANTGIEADAGYLNEGFADFFASQVAGAVNYAPVRPFFSSPTLNDAIMYCDADPRGTEPSCLESGPTELRFPTFDDPDNIDNGAVYDPAAGATAALLLDVFDGHPRLSNNPLPPLPNNGAVWVPLKDALGRPLAQGVEAAPRPGLRFNDEVVRLPADALKTLLEEWAKRQSAGEGFKKEDFFPALTATMRQHGFNDSQICQVFALRAPTSPDGRAARCDDLMGAAALELNAGALAFELGDLVAPMAVFCTLPAPSTVRCEWDDTSIGAQGYVYALRATADGEVLGSGELTPPPGHVFIGNHAAVIMPVRAGFSGDTRFRVQTLKHSSTGGRRLSPPALGAQFVPPAAPPLCGNGTVDPGEACDSSSVMPSKCGIGICSLVKTCSEDCTQLFTECVCDAL